MIAQMTTSAESKDQSSQSNKALSLGVLVCTAVGADPLRGTKGADLGGDGL